LVSAHPNPGGKSAGLVSAAVGPLPAGTGVPNILIKLRKRREARQWRPGISQVILAIIFFKRRIPGHILPMEYFDLEDTPGPPPLPPPTGSKVKDHTNSENILNLIITADFSRLRKSKSGCRQ
jgi:hypothetical protein